MILITYYYFECPFSPLSLLQQNLLFFFFLLKKILIGLKFPFTKLFFNKKNSQDKKSLGTQSAGWLNEGCEMIVTFFFHNSTLLNLLKVVKR